VASLCAEQVVLFTAVLLIATPVVGPLTLGVAEKEVRTLAALR
jgi:archaellum component FlaG (FlaF/FlaG flagellin family)